MIAIVNHGLGNIRAFANIFQNLGVPIVIATRPEELAKATKIILPGVGAFDHAMESLDASGMRDRLNVLVLQQQLPVLGVCVGMQILGDSSEEGARAGLGWLHGTVRKIRFGESGERRLLPHMGWNTVQPVAPSELLAGLGDDAAFYFLHSYYFDCADPRHVLARTEYAQSFACAIRSGNIYGVQFHPEKSHHNGIRLLKNFAEL
jgi:glutamine amidotransferase